MQTHKCVAYWLTGSNQSKVLGKLTYCNAQALFVNQVEQSPHPPRAQQLQAVLALSRQHLQLLAVYGDCIHMKVYDVCDTCYALAYPSYTNHCTPGALASGAGRASCWSCSSCTIDIISRAASASGCGNCSCSCALMCIGSSSSCNSDCTSCCT